MGKNLQEASRCLGAGDDATLKKGGRREEHREWRLEMSSSMFCQRPTLVSPLGQISYYNNSNNDGNKLHNSKHFRYNSSFNDHSHSVRKGKLREVNDSSKVGLISSRAGLSCLPNHW